MKDVVFFNKVKKIGNPKKKKSWEADSIPEFPNQYRIDKAAPLLRPLLFTFLKLLFSRGIGIKFRLVKHYSRN